MSVIFISHSSEDRTLAQELAGRLRVQGYDALFLDFDLTDGIPAGQRWERELFGGSRRLLRPERRTRRLIERSSIMLLSSSLDPEPPLPAWRTGTVREWLPLAQAGVSGVQVLVRDGLPTGDLQGET
jgi:hypothetical protein